MRSFKYKIGNIETIIPWSKPDKIQLEKWYRDFIQIPGMISYKIKNDIIVTIIMRIKREAHNGNQNKTGNLEIGDPEIWESQ